MIFSITLFVFLGFFLCGNSLAEMNVSVSGLELGEPDENGRFLVEKVYEDSPAEDAGIMPRDLLIEVDHLSLCGKSAGEVENALSMRLGEGRSSVVTLLGVSGKVVTWLKPSRYNIEQRETLDFCQKLLWQKEIADSYWKQADELFRKAILKKITVDEFDMEMPKLTRGIRQSRLSISKLDLPVHAGTETRALCARARNKYANAQFLRNEARARMEDYSRARWGDNTFLQERWDKIEPSVMEADKLNGHGDIILDQVLRSIGYDKNRESLERS
jgi:hypothetical protein